jgi:hypothetical protein
MQLFSYLSRIASGGSLLAWDGTKIIPFKPITQDAFTGAISVSGTLTTDAIVTHDLIAGNKIKALGGLYGSLTELADGSPYIQAGENINVITTSLGSIEISGKEQTPVLWRWNESDVSQFNINCDTIGTGSLSVANCSWGKAIRVDFKENSNEGIFAFSINDLDLELDSANRYRYILKFRLCNFSGIPREWVGIGATFLSNDEQYEKYYGLGNVCYFNSQNSKAIKVEAGQVSIGKYAPNGPRIPLTVPYGRPTTSLEYEVSSLITRKSIGFQNSLRVISQVTTINGGAGQDDSYYTAEFGSFKGTWAKQNLSSCGIIILAGAGTSQAHFDIDNIEVIKHPMDW